MDALLIKGWRSSLAYPNCLPTQKPENMRKWPLVSPGGQRGQVLWVEGGTSNDGLDTGPQETQPARAVTQRPFHRLVPLRRYKSGRKRFFEKASVFSLSKQ